VLGMSRKFGAVESDSKNEPVTKNSRLSGLRDADALLLPALRS
jgi:hypothetical protein